MAERARGTADPRHGPVRHPHRQAAPRVPSGPAPACAGEAGQDDRAAAGPAPIPLTVHVTRPQMPLDSGADASNTPAVVDPLVAALAQLVRDRWAAERRERARVRVVEGKR